VWVPDARAADVTAPCREGDPDLWFSEQPADLEAAKAYCRRCPVRALCLDRALARGEPWGVWGGHILVDGAVVATKRARGRPPKTATVAA
jgi:WhiB family transcriptional regulator, redox-sensing transcriptional regulator